MYAAEILLVDDMIRFFIKVISKPFEWLLPDFFKIQEPPLLVSLINKLSNDFSWLGEPQRDEFLAFIDSMKSSNGASVKRCLVIKTEKKSVWDNILNFLLFNRVFKAFFII